jgi:hypothetical protein
MRGKLDILPVNELLRFALREDRSGVLELERDGQHGRIAFSRGWIMEAISPSVRGQPSDRETTAQAIAELRSWRSGRFQFDLTGDREASLEIDLSRLLSEALTANDRG